jgi:hypothetical protein
MHMEGHIVMSPLSNGMPLLAKRKAAFRAPRERILQRQMIEEFPATGESGGTGNRNE